MAKRKQAKQKTHIDHRATSAQSANEPKLQDLIRKPDVTASATVRFDCGVFIKVTHAEYMPHEVMALVKQGQAQLDPVAPGQVGTLVLNGFPYTVLGYYTFSEQDAEYDDAPREYSFHGPFYDFYRHKAASIREMANAIGEDFENSRQLTRDLRATMDKAMARRQKRQPRSQKSRKA